MSMKRKPLIAVGPLYDSAKDSLWMLPGYLDGLTAAGAIPIILPLHIQEEDYCQIKDSFNGYLLTGGHDINPALYNASRTDFCGDCCDARDRLESLVYKYAFADDRPVLGICRGIQLINVLMGGTLYQDIPDEFASEIHLEHHMQAPYDRTVHGIHIVHASPLEQLWHKRTKQVNSYHHQGIRTLGNDLEIMANADDGLIEGIYVPDHRFIWGIQWHPEFIYQKDTDQNRIFQKFVEACTDENNLIQTI